MAVEGSQKRIRDFQNHHQRVVFWIIIISQAVTAIGASAVLYASGIVKLDSPILWLIPVVMFSLGISILLMCIRLITEPLSDVLAALSHKIGEPTLNTPPNPNSKRNEQTGFKTVLQAIYDDELGNHSTDQPHTNEDGAQSLLTNALNHTSYGLTILGPDKSIISANASTPIAHDQEGQPFLALDFIDDESILSWIESCDEKTISAERRWQRVATDPRFVKKQRFFDIVASYEKGAAAETVILLIDQSKHYSPEEEDLNFIAFAAHELRGPITVIRGYLDILDQELSDRLKGDEAELINRLIVSSNRLSSYINNILNVSRFDRHHLQVHLYEEHVSTIYAAIADDMQLRAKAQHRLLNISIPATLPTVAADRGSIGEVIGNLIDNAIKYSFEGGTVTVQAAEKGDFVEISVIDNGVGMPASVVKNLFRKFYRSHRSRETIAGTGIGLYICKAFIESHGGSISVRSRENEGSAFSFTLPVYSSVADKLLEDGQLNQSLVRRGGGWIKNHAMYRR